MFHQNPGSRTRLFNMGKGTFGRYLSVKNGEQPPLRFLNEALDPCLQTEPLELARHEFVTCHYRLCL